jgi:ABC-type cobalt transport system substrate-binding protein
MELLVKPEILTSYIFGPTFGNVESLLFIIAAQFFNTESMQKVILWHSCV